MRPAIKLLIACTLSAIVLPGVAETVGWRTDGGGRYPDTTPLLSWSTSEGVLWKTKLAATSNASPVLLDDESLIFVMSEPDGILALNSEDGSIVWTESTGAVAEKNVGTHKANGRATATPVSDGKGVFTVFGSGVVAAYDLDGKRRWARVVQEPTHRWGHSASPALGGGNLIVHLVDLIALDPETGEEVWRSASEARWGTPVVARIAETDVVITPAGDVFRAIDGKPIASAIGSLKYATPVIQDGVIYFIEKKATAVRVPDAIEGPFDVLWESRLKGSRHYASPVIHNGLVYAVSREQQFTILDAASGEVVHESRLDLDSGSNAAYPSIAVAGDKIFVSTENGTTAVLEPGRTYDEFSRNSLEGFRSSPVFSGNRMYVRTFEHLYCIADRR